MKIKLDENIPIRLAWILQNLGHETETVASEGLTGRPDFDVWAAARREGRFFITQDLDFADIHHFKPGTHPGLLVVRLREPSGNAIVKRTSGVILENSLVSWSGCFVVLSDNKLRIKWPENPGVR